MQNLDSNQQEYWSIHEARYSFLQKQLTSLLPPKAKVLDIGCYPPFLLDWLEQKGFETFGIASEHEKIARKNVQILNIDHDPFPWKARTFDAVIFTEVLEHLPYSPLVALREARRVLKSNGLLILSTPNITKLQNRVKILAGKTISFPVEQLIATEPGSTNIYHRHNKEYTKQEIEKLLRIVGLEIQESKYVSFYPPTRTKVKKEPIFIQIFKWFGFIPQVIVPGFRDSIFVVGKNSSKN